MIQVGLSHLSLLSWYSPLSPHCIVQRPPAIFSIQLSSAPQADFSTTGRKASLVCKEVQLWLAEGERRHLFLAQLL